jgi:hypothetical protein
VHGGQKRQELAGWRPGVGHPWQGFCKLWPDSGRVWPSFGQIVLPIRLHDVAGSFQHFWPGFLPFLMGSTDNQRSAVGMNHLF